MNTKKLPGIVVVGLFAISFLLAGQFATANLDGTTLMAYSTTDSIVLDGQATESFWATSDQIVITDIDGSGYDVIVKAANNGSHIFVYATWNDPYANNTRKGWSFNGTDWENVGGNEDRIEFAFANGSANMVCGHNPGTADSMLFDIWHWKASRTDPAGWADDKYWDGSGRQSDAKTAGGYKDNSVVVQADNASAITSALGNSSVVAAFGDDDRPFWDNNGVEISWSNGENATPLSDFIAGYKTDVPTGSRGDVLTGSMHNGTSWQVEFLRALDTTHSADDITFTNGVAVPFFLAIHDNSGDDSHYRAGGATPTEFSLTVTSETGLPTTTTTPPATTTTTETTTTTTTDTTTTTPPPGTLDFTLIAAIAGSLLIVALIVVIYLRRGS
ncbi:MAG: hypothetical protein JSW61_10615 [Candidatus Thorarchaeota archaeon]|nr:MAG: hypothetical protein JSW61_10615 [Candidatus Thorarchaeota archaeon]